MPNLLVRALLIVTLATVPLQVLVLRDGTRLEVDGPVSVRDGHVVFRRSGGALYSIALSEVDQEATRAASEAVVVSESLGREDDDWPKLTDIASPRLTAEEKDNLLRQLEKNHSGVAASPQTRSEEPRPSSSVVEVSTKSEEWSWRERARGYREALLRAQEDLQLLLNRQRELEDRILTFTSLGYRSSQFTYDTSQLGLVREQIPIARLELTRAQRALDQFLEDARKQAILPGWLR